MIGIVTFGSIIYYADNNEEVSEDEGEVVSPTCINTKHDSSSTEVACGVQFYVAPNLKVSRILVESAATAAVDLHLILAWQPSSICIYWHGNHCVQIFKKGVNVALYPPIEFY